MQKLRLERMRVGTFNDNARLAGHPETRFRTCWFGHRPAFGEIGFERTLRRFPYVPNRPEQLDQDCYEAFNIQVQGLVRRFEATGGKHLVIGVSGGLDSTHALIVAAKACDTLGLPRSNILGFTMPGFATSEQTRGNAWLLMNALGVTGEEIDIKPAATQMLGDMGHPFASGEPVYDITFENVQAGLRTDYLFRLANQRAGLVVGTGDLSEIALGWSTYGVGDQMSHYGVNAGVPKTLIQYLIRWTIKTGQFDEATEPRPAGDPRHEDLAGAGAGGCGWRHAVDRGPDRSLRAARFLPLPHPAPRPAALQGRLPRARGVEGCRRRALAVRLSRGAEAGLRPAHDPQMAGGLPLPLLPAQPVQAHRHPQFAQGLGRRRAVAARRLARAERRQCRALAGRVEGGVRGMIIVTGGVTARPDSFEALRQACLDHCERSRTEDGCLSHAVHVDAGDPLRLFFYEEWTDLDALQAHFRQPGSATFIAAVRAHAAASTPPAVFEASPIQ